MVVRKMSDFKWTAKRTAVALALAKGYTIREAAEQARVNERTIYRWKKNLEFDLEVDRLTLLTGIASRAERLRIAMRAIRQGVQDTGIKTKRDILDWLKFAQSETDGAKLNLAAIFENMASSAAIEEGDEEETEEE